MGHVRPQPRSADVIKTVGLVTSARSDLSLYLPLMRCLTESAWCDLRVIATGMHLSPRFGLTVRDIAAHGFPVAERIDSLVDDDTPEAIACSMGKAVIGFSALFARWRPDALMVLGDRFDMYPAALAALPFRIPVAHIAGGELSEGAMDDALRHSLTKLSHLHFVAMDEFARRVGQLGEEPWRITVCGALALDAIRTLAPWTPAETAGRFDLALNRPIGLVTYHPVTLEYERAAEQIQALLAALDRVGIQYVFTYPNADTASQHILAAVQRFCEGRTDRRLVVNAGPVGYFSLMRTASVMVGNSSSGLIEAPSFKLPVVNVGTRQSGRFAVENVIHCGSHAEAIVTALQRALSAEFRATLQGLHNPYGDGHAAERIAERLPDLLAHPQLLQKRFMASGAALLPETVPV